METTEKIRYGGRDKIRTPKNTLITLKNGKGIYFGIARCNKKFDVFSREKGKFIARRRAETALKRLPNGTDTSLSALVVGDSGLFGVTNNIPTLLEYFRGIDDHIKTVTL